MTVKQYKSKYDVEVINMTLGLTLQPGEIIEVDYDKKTVKNISSGEESKVPNVVQLIDGIKGSNKLEQRLEGDANFEEVKGKQVKIQKKGDA